MVSERDKVPMPIVTGTDIPEDGKLANSKDTGRFPEAMVVATVESGEMGSSTAKGLKLPLMELSDMMVNG